MAEDLNSGLPWTNPASGQSGTWTQGLRILLEVRRSNHSATLPPKKEHWLLICIIYQTQEENTASASAAFHATSYSLSHFLYASEVKLTSVRPFYSEGLGLWRNNLARPVFSCHLLLWPPLKWKKPEESSWSITFYSAIYKSKIKVSKRKVGTRPVRACHNVKISTELDNLNKVLDNN